MRPLSAFSILSCEDDGDDMLAYQRALLDYSMVILSWMLFQKEMENVLSVAGNFSYIISPPLDMEQIHQEKARNGVGGWGHYNKSVKEAIKKLGPSASRESLDRICHSLGITTERMHNFDSNLLVFKRFGKHVRKSTKGDLGNIVKELVSNKAFTYTSGRRYRFFFKNEAKYSDWI